MKFDVHSIHREWSDDNECVCVYGGGEDAITCSRTKNPTLYIAVSCHSTVCLFVFIEFYRIQDERKKINKRIERKRFGVRMDGREWKRKRERDGGEKWNQVFCFFLFDLLLSVQSHRSQMVTCCAIARGVLRGWDWLRSVERNMRCIRRIDVTIKFICIDASTNDRDREC